LLGPDRFPLNFIPDRESSANSDLPKFFLVCALFESLPLYGIVLYLVYGTPELLNIGAMIALVFILIARGLYVNRILDKSSQN